MSVKIIMEEEELKEMIEHCINIQREDYLQFITDGSQLPSDKSVLDGLVSTLLFEIKEYQKDKKFAYTDEEIMEMYPEVQIKFELLNNGLFSPTTIYGKIRLFRFRIYKSMNVYTDEKCLRMANIDAVKYTWESFNKQRVVANYDFIDKNELEIALNKKI